MRSLIIMMALALTARAAVAQTKADTAKAWRLWAQAKPDTTKLRKRPWYDTTKAPKDTAWVASRKGHTYYLDGCRGAMTLTPANTVRFKTEAEAKALGLTRSKQWGC